MRRLFFAGLAAALTFATPGPLTGQVVRSFASRFTANATGDILLIGNSSMSCDSSAVNGIACSSARNGLGSLLNNNDFKSRHLDIDADGSTFNSSSANLTLPSGATVLWAGLFWGGDVAAQGSGGVAAPDATMKDRVLLGTPAAGYSAVVSTATDASGSDYGAFRDVTALVQAGGTGTYTVANIQAGAGIDKYAAWGLVVVIQDPAQPLRNLTVFDGYAKIFRNTTNIPVSGFTTPLSGPVTTRLGTVSFEGDKAFLDDQLILNGTPLSDLLNPADNFFASTNTRLGSRVSSKNPDFANLMGGDVDVVDASGLIGNGATSATITMTSADDEYYPAAITFVTDLYPAADVATTVTGPTVAAPGTSITYTVTVTNTGPLAATNLIVRDTLPAGVTVTGITGGGTQSGNVITWPTIVTLAVAGSTSFTVTVTVPGSGPIVNLVASTATSPDPNLSNNNGTASSSRVTTAIQPLADVSLVLSGPANVASGGSITYTLVATNNGPNPAINVALFDTLPAGVTFVSASNGGILTSSVVSWPVIASLANGGSVTYTVVVTAPLSGTLVSVTGGTSTTTDPTPGNNDGSAAANRVTTTVAGTADIAVTVTGPAIVNPSGTVTYTVTVTNNGPTASSGIVVTDTLPGTGTFVSASGGGVRAGNLVTWPTIASLASGATRTFTVVWTAPASGSITNLAASTATTPDPDGTNNNGSAAGRLTTAVQPVADVALTKTGPAFVVANGTVTYSIAARNNGPSAATTVVLTDTLPAGSSFVSATGGGTASGGVVTWPAIASLANGATQSFSVVITGPAAGTLTNIVASTAGTADLTPANNNGSAAANRVTSTVSATADLMVTKTGPPTASSASNITYTITVTNNGPNAAPTVVVRDTLPATGTFVSASNGGVRAGRVVTWPTIASLANGASQSYTVVWTTPATGSITNLATGTAATGDPDLTNNDGSTGAARVTTTITASADLQVTETGTTTIVASDTITYRITIRNNGPNTIASAVITDTLPAGVTFLNASNGGTVSGGVVTWPTIATLTNGSTLLYTLQVLGPASGSVTNIVAGTAATGDQTPTNNDGSAAGARVTTTVAPAADLAISKTGPVAALGGDTLTFSITVTNNGPNAATNVVVTDTMPTTITFISASAGGVRAGRVVTWPATASLANGASQTYSVVMRAPATGPLVNLAAATATSGDPNPADNDGSAAASRVTTTLTPAADLQVTQSGPAAIGPGGAITYTITVRNNGLSAATGVAVTDTLPAAVTFVSASGGGTFAAGVVSWPAIASLANGATQTFTVVATAPATGSFTATAAGTHGLADPNPVNNNGSLPAAKVTTTISTAADLTVTVSGPTAVPSLATFSYIVTVTNNGPSPAVNVVVTDTVPGAVTFMSATGSGSLAAGVISWPTIALLASGASQTYTVTVTAPVSGSFVNVVAGTTATPDPDATNNNGTAATSRLTSTVAPVADVAVSKTGPATVLANGTVNYTVTITNNGPSVATGVVVSDSLPPGSTNVVASDGATVGEGILTWPTIPSLAIGATLTYTVSVRAPEVGPMLNVVASTATTADSTPNNNNGSAVVSRVITAVTEVSDVVVTQTGPATASPGGMVTYTVTVVNNGPSPASNIVVTDTLPGVVTFVSASSGGVASGSVVTWPTIPLLPISGSQTYTVVVTAPSTSATFTSIAASSSPTLDPVPANNNGSAAAARVTTVVTVLSADVATTKTGPATVAPNGTMTYTVTVSNAGPSAAANVIVSDTLPTGIAFVSATSGGVASGSVVTWPAIASLANGASQAFTLVTTAPASGGPLLNVIASTSTTNDPTPANNNGSAGAARVTTTLLAPADIVVSKTGPASVLPGGSIGYTVVVTNIGGSSAANVIVTDTLPSAATFLNASDGGALAGNVVTWPAISSLAPSASITYTVTTTAPLVAGTLTNVVAGTTTSPDANPGNNNGSAAAARVNTTVITGADIVAAKVGPATAAPGGIISYAITVTNNGPTAASQVVIVDSLPLGASFVNASDGGTLTGRIVTWPTIPSLANGASVQYTVGVTAPDSGSITNVVAATSSTTDPNPANNNGSSGIGRSGTTIVPQADVVATKSGPSAAAVGDSVVYQITVTNQGPHTANAVVVTDSLPSGATFVRASNGGAVAAGVITWPTVAALTNGQSLTYSVVVLTTGVGALTNVVAAHSPTLDPDPSNNDGSTTPSRVVTNVVERADVVATKTGPAIVDAGGSIGYTITITNRGPSAAANVIVIDSLPAGVTFTSATNGGVLAGRVVSWPAIPNLGVGQAVTHTLTVLAPTTGSVTNVVAATTTTPDSDPSNNNGQSTAARPTTTIRPIDVAIVKSHVGDFTVGTTAHYTLAVTNVGTVATRGPLTVVDSLPTGLGFLNYSGPGWTCSAPGRVMTCANPATLAPTEHTEIDLIVSVGTDATASIANRAYVATPGDESGTGNNVSTDGVTVSRLSPLVVEKRSKKTDAEIGDLVDYEIDVSNVATGTVPSVQLTDVIPLGFSYVIGTARVNGLAAPDPDGVPGPTLVFSLGDIAGNSTVRATYGLRIGAGATAGTGVNTVQAKSTITGVSSAQATARVRIRGGVFSDRGFIVGKVAIQFDSADTRRDIGIPGVRVVLNDGTSAVTDEEGKYSFVGLAAQLLVLKIDRTTLPPEVRLTVTNARQVGNPYSRLVDLKFGELHRADFLMRDSGRTVGRQDGQEIETRRAMPSDQMIRARAAVEQRRTGGEVFAAIPDTAVATISSDRVVSGAVDPTGVSRDPTDSASIGGVYQPNGLSLNSSVGLRQGLTKVHLAERLVRDRPNARRIALTVPGNGIPADGASVVAIQIRVVDQSNQPVGGAVPITLESSLGRWQVEDKDPAEPGIQTILAEGGSTLGLVSSAEPGLGEIRVTSDEMSQIAELAFVPAARPLIAAGLLQGRIDLRSLTKGSVVSVTPSDGFEEELTAIAASSSTDLTRASARGALYLKGKVQGKYLLTARYDTERDGDARLFRDIRPEEFYPVYGDASVREFGAQSYERLYVRVDHNRNYFLYGDYETPSASGNRELGAYLRSFTGAVQHLENNTARLNVFASRSRSSQVIDELPGRGVSGPYALTRPDGRVNSERVELITRDRNQPSRILKLETMRRFADYSLEPFNGRIIFRRPVPSVDADLNPIFVRISYEVEQGANSYWLVGGDAQVKVGRRVELGASVVNEDDPLAKFKMLSLNGTFALAQGTTVNLEWATADRGGLGGRAARFEIRHHSGRFDAYGFAAGSDTAFANRSSAFAAGRSEMGIRGGYVLDSLTRIIAEAIRSADNRTSGKREGGLVAVERRFGQNIHWQVGYRYGHETLRPASGTTVGATPNTTNAFHTRLTWDLVGADSLALGARRRGSLFAEFDQDLAHGNQRRGSLGAEYQLLKRLRVFARHEFLNSFAGPYALNQDQRTQATVIGFDAGYGDDGQVFSEYRLRDGLSGRDGEAVIGLRNRWVLSRGLRFDGSIERIKKTSGTQNLGNEGTAVAGALEFTRDSLGRGTARLEYRDDPTLGANWLGSLGYARKLSDDWTTLGRIFWNDLGRGDQVRTRAQLGLAWRQTKKSDFTGLARFERTFERLPTALTLIQNTTHGVSLISGHLNWQATEHFVATGRFAQKWASDSSQLGRESTRATLLMIRGLYDLGRSWDLGAMASSLSSYPLGGRRFGLGLEVGRRVIDDLRVGLGYNLLGFRDRDLRDTEYTLRGFYLRLDYKFDEGLFGHRQEDRY